MKDKGRRRVRKTVDRILYCTWRNMIQRCYNKKHPNYKDYGARSIRVCHSWRSSCETFKKWAVNNGWARGRTLDRKNNDRGYAPWNCRYVTHEINLNNTRKITKIAAYGETKSYSRWSRDTRCRVPKPTLQHRLDHGWSPEKAISTPPKIQNDRKYGAVASKIRVLWKTGKYTKTAIGQIVGLSRTSVRQIIEE
jgi:hypothetical protein